MHPGTVQKCFPGMTGLNLSECPVSWVFINQGAVAQRGQGNCWRLHSKKEKLGLSPRWSGCSLLLRASTTHADLGASAQLPVLRAYPDTVLATLVIMATVYSENVLFFCVSARVRNHRVRLSAPRLCIPILGFDIVCCLSISPTRIRASGLLSPQVSAGTWHPESPANALQMKALLPYLTDIGL